MKAIWTDEAAEFHGDFVDFDPLWSYPKPKQVGGPPIPMGASSKYMYKRIVEYCDGWFPIYQDEARAAASGATDYSESMRLTHEAWKVGAWVLNFTVFGVGPILRLLSVAFLTALIESSLHYLQPLPIKYCLGRTICQFEKQF